MDFLNGVPAKIKQWYGSLVNYVFQVRGDHQHHANPQIDYDVEAALPTQTGITEELTSQVEPIEAQLQGPVVQLPKWWVRKVAVEIIMLATAGTFGLLQMSISHASAGTTKILYIACTMLLSATFACAVVGATVTYIMKPNLLHDVIIISTIGLAIIMAILAYVFAVALTLLKLG